MGDITAEKVLLWLRVEWAVFAVALPAAYAILALTLDIEPLPGLPEGTVDMIVYITLAVMTVFPALYLLMELLLFAVVKPKMDGRDRAAVVNLGTSHVKVALVHLVYLVGLLTFFVSDRTLVFVYFAVPAILWTAAYWPTTGRFERFIARSLRSES
jgi:hypothetical protein